MSYKLGKTKLCELGNFKVKVIDLYCYGCFRLFPDVNTFQSHPHESFLNQISNLRSRSYHVDRTNTKVDGRTASPLINIMDDVESDDEQLTGESDDDNEEESDDCIMVEQRSSNRNGLKRKAGIQSSAVINKIIKRSNSSGNININGRNIILRRSSTNNNNKDGDKTIITRQVSNTNVSKKGDGTKVVSKSNSSNSTNGNESSTHKTIINLKELKDYLHCIKCIEGGKITAFCKLPELIQHFQSCQVQQDPAFVEYMKYMKKNPSQSLVNFQKQEQQVQSFKEKKRVEDLEKCNNELTEKIEQLKEQTKQLNRLLNQQELTIQRQKAVLDRYRQKELEELNLKEMEEIRKQKELMTQKQKQIEQRELKELEERKQIEKLREQKQKQNQRPSNDVEQMPMSIDNDDENNETSGIDSFEPQNEHDDNIDSPALPSPSNQEQSPDVERPENLNSTTTTTTSTLDPSSKKNKPLRRKRTVKDSNRALQPKSHVCQVCNFAFRTKSLLRKHYEIHLDKRYKCEFCLYTNVRRATLVHHLLRHPGKDSYHCVEEACEESFSCVGELTDHMYTHNLHYKPPSSENGNVEKSHKCNQCEKSFFNKNSLEMHMVCHNDGAAKPWKCTECDDSFNQRHVLKWHMMSHQPDAQPFVCPVCQKTFKSLSILKSHSYSHKEANLQCDICGRKYKFPHKLRHHMATHNAERNHLCQICGQSYISPWHLKSHVNNVHKKIKNHLCCYCGAAFSKNFDLEAHKRRHTGEKPFVCDVCGSAWAMAYSLRKHKLTHLDEKPLECKFCAKRFRFRNVLKRHIQTHTGDKPYGCKFCDERFRDNRVLKKHVVFEHGEEVEFDLDNPQTYQRPKGEDLNE